MIVPGQGGVRLRVAVLGWACSRELVTLCLDLSFQGGSEMLQCPRCQASVPAHPGVCGTCGENVYQCHKCRYGSQSLSLSLSLS